LVCFGGDSLELKAVFSFFCVFLVWEMKKIDRNLGNFPISRTFGNACYLKFFFGKN
jgi:hypothetical protein